MTDSTNGGSRPPLTEEQIRAARNSPLLRTLYRIAKAQVERGAHTLPGTEPLSPQRYVIERHRGQGLTHQD